ncbi:MAG: nucleotide disphospho-sugar-binding domain-containing protein [Dermatophilaceae bacterium]
MATLLFATIPIPAHTRNAAPFAARLIGAGHEVLWYAGRAFHPFVEALGATALAPVEAADFDAGEVARRWPAFASLDDVRAIRAAYTQVFVGQATRRASDLGGVLAATPVHALLTDGLSYGAGLAAERAAVPWATFGDTPLGFPDEDTPPFGSGLPPMPGFAGRLRNKAVSVALRRAVFAKAQRRYQRARSELGLPRSARTIFEDNQSPYLHLHGATPSFEYPRRELPGHVHWVGPLRPDPPAQWEPPVWWPQVTNRSRPVVLVSQGTIRADVNELIVPTLHALADLDITVVVTTGLARPAAVQAALDGAVPDNARLARFLPYAMLLPHVDVFVTNGGYTGVTLALAHGIPIVQAGETEEKPDIGARIHWSGVGVRLGTTRPTPAAVRAAVRLVLTEPAYRLAAQRLQAEMAPHDAGREGAALLLRLAETGKPVLRPAVRRKRPGA